MKFNTFLLNPGHILVHFGPVLVQWLKKKSMWTSNEIAITERHRCQNMAYDCCTKGHYIHSQDGIKSSSHMTKRFPSNELKWPRSSY